MEILISIGAFALGVALSIWPIGARKLSTFFDTLIHEAGHGLSSLPFGAPLPAITVRKNTSGETQSAMGYLHQFLPLGLGVLTEKNRPISEPHGRLLGESTLRCNAPGSRTAL